MYIEKTKNKTILNDDPIIIFTYAVSSGYVVNRIKKENNRERGSEREGGRERYKGKERNGGR